MIASVRAGIVAALVALLSLSLTVAASAQKAFQRILTGRIEVGRGDVAVGGDADDAVLLDRSQGEFHWRMPG